MSSLPGPSGYELVPFREGADFTLYRGRQYGNPSPVLAIALSEEQPSPQSVQRLEHEYSLAVELDRSWAAKPLALTRHEGRTFLILNDGSPRRQDHSAYWQAISPTDVDARTLESPGNNVRGISLLG